MATFLLHPNLRSEDARPAKRAALAEGTIPFGRLITQGTLATQVKVTAVAGTETALGYSAINENVASQQTDTAAADKEYYTSGDPCEYWPLQPGDEVYLLVDSEASSAVTLGDRLSPATSGTVQTVASASGSRTVAVALAAANTGARVKCRIVAYPNLATD